MLREIRMSGSATVGVVDYRLVDILLPNDVTEQANTDGGAWDGPSDLKGHFRTGEEHPWCRRKTMPFLK